MKAENLQSQVAEWRDVLTALAEDFYTGSANVDPKQYPKTCSHCEQRLLCRLDPATLNDSALDDDPDTNPNSSAPENPEATRG